MAVSMTDSGLVYSATQSPGQTAGSNVANTLDNYEEGTWTPVAKVGGSSMTSSVSINNYTVIGNVCWCLWYVNLNATQPLTGTVTVTGLPFTVVKSGGTFSVSGNDGCNFQDIEIRPGASGTTANHYIHGLSTNSGGLASMTHARIGSTAANKAMNGSIWYQF